MRSFSSTRRTLSIVGRTGGLSFCGAHGFSAVPSGRNRRRSLHRCQTGHLAAPSLVGCRELRVARPFFLVSELIKCFSELFKIDFN